MRILRIAAPGLLTFAVALIASGVLSARTLDPLPTSPLLTLILVPVVRATMFISGTTAVGGALIGGVIGDDEAARLIGRRSALVFAAASAAMLVVNLADVLAVQWWQAFDTTMLVSFMTQIDEGRYLMMQVVLGGTGALVLSSVRHRIDGAIAFTLIMVAVLLPGFTGHSTAVFSHWIASMTMIFHLAAMDIWLGGVLVLLVAYNAQALVRFTPIALSSYVVLVLSGVASLIARIADWNAMWHSKYVVVLGAKVFVALVIGGIAAVKLRPTAAKALEGGEAVGVALRRTLAIEASLMLVAVGFGVTLARMANP